MVTKAATNQTTTKSNERAERAKRAQAAGRAKASTRRNGDSAVAATTAPTKAPKTVIRESPDQAAKRALARVNEAEAARTARASTGVAVRAATAPATKRAAQRQPAKRSTTTAPEAGHADQLHSTVRNMEVNHLQCRDFGHSWRPYSARWLQTYNSYESQLICQRCRTIRTRFLSSTGSQLGGGYDYAEGYLVKGMGRLTGTDRDVIRLASIQAVLVTDTADDE